MNSEGSVKGLRCARSGSYDQAATSNYSKEGGWSLNCHRKCVISSATVRGEGGGGEVGERECDDENGCNSSAEWVSFSKGCNRTPRSVGRLSPA